ncbi:hypothetical protein BDW71DRAFT_60045 [Aspergillus fruticulosus]
MLSHDSSVFNHDGKSGYEFYTQYDRWIVYGLSTSCRRHRMTCGNSLEYDRIYTRPMRELKLPKGSCEPCKLQTSSQPDRPPLTPIEIGYDTEIHNSRRGSPIDSRSPAGQFCSQTPSSARLKGPRLECHPSHQVREPQRDIRPKHQAKDKAASVTVAIQINVPSLVPSTVQEYSTILI